MNKKDFALKLSCVALSTVMLFSSIPVFAKGADDITITNPYANINWSTVNQYKTALHTHTNASDGDHTLRESLERHEEAGFDAVAITDHGTVDYGWTEKEGSQLIYKAMKLVGKTEGELDYLGESGAFSNGVTYRNVTENGNNYLKADTGRSILQIPYGIEHNAISVNAHVNSWFADFSRNLPSDYADAIKGVDKAGGVSVINHPGEYSTARYELYQEDAYDLSNPAYKYIFNKFYGLVNDYDSCIGIDINSKGDDRTRYDRKLWDLMLTEAAKSGKTVSAIATSDAHQPDKIDTGFTYILAKENTSTAIRNSLENGEMFAASSCISNHDELLQSAQAIKELYGETEFYNELMDIIERYEAERIEKQKKAKKSNVGVKYTALDDDGYFNRDARPMICSIAVDDSENTITLNSENALIVRWISGGQLIETTKAGETTIDLDDYKDVLNGYVRAEVFGEGGVVYTQGFTLNAEQAEEQEFKYSNYGMLDFLVTDVNMVLGLISRWFKNLFN